MNPGNPWTMYRTRFLVRARQLSEPLIFTDALGREQSGRAGDYLVEFAEGVRRITARIVFEDIYIPLAGALPGKEGVPGVLGRAVAQDSREHRSATVA
jgi:hypothetical protein